MGAGGQVGKPIVSFGLNEMIGCTDYRHRYILDLKHYRQGISLIDCCWDLSPNIL